MVWGVGMDLSRRSIIASIGMVLTASAGEASPQSDASTGTALANIKHGGSKPTAFTFKLQNRARGHSCFCAMAFRKVGIPGDTRYPRSPKPVSTPSRRICGVMGKPTRHLKLRHTASCTLSVTWSPCSALQQRQAIVVGHDWGATVAWHAALLRPDLFRAVAALSVPFRQRGPAPPLRLLREAGLYTYYWLYYQDEGPAEKEYERDPRATLRRTFYSLSGDAPRGRPNVRILQPGEGALDNTIDPEHLPSWLTEADLDYMTADLARTGFRGGLNWYRNIDRNWELPGPWAGAVIGQKALFIAGTEDHVINGPTGKAQLAEMTATVPNLKRQFLIEGASHYIQQERPQEVNMALIDFLNAVAIR